MRVHGRKHRHNHRQSARDIFTTDNNGKDVFKMGLEKIITKLLEKLLEKPLAKLARHVEKWNKEADEARAAEAAAEAAKEQEQTANPESGAEVEETAAGAADKNAACLARYPLGLASCWGGSNASKRMMNCLAPKMADATFKDRIKFMVDRGCTVAHVILANGGDGESAGYAAWRDSDRAKMLERFKAVEAAGLVPVPWLITDDSSALRRELFGNPEKLIKAMADFILGAPYVVLGLEMDEDKATLGEWRKVRDALRKIYAGPIGTHHTSGNTFAFASLGDIVLGQLNPGCTESQVASQIAAIRKMGKRAVGFEYERSPSRKLSVAALKAGAEGCGNWDGGDVPGVENATAEDPLASNATTTATQTQSGESEDGVDFSMLKWNWGGFSGGGAKLDAKARIYNLSVKSSGMTYKWMQGGCENLGAKSKEDAACLACLFCLIGGSWVGGKFDWISTSRLSRDFKNISDGYCGWDRQAVSKADKFAFVIVSKDGKRRTNVIACGK